MTTPTVRGCRATLSVSTASDGFSKMSRTEILSRWPSITATVEQRKHQLDRIGVEDIADSIAHFTRKFIDGDEQQRRDLTRNRALHDDQVRINRELGLDHGKGT